MKDKFAESMALQDRINTTIAETLDTLNDKTIVLGDVNRGLTEICKILNARITDLEAQIISLHNKIEELEG